MNNQNYNGRFLSPYGKWVELYTPVVGRVSSPSKQNMPLEFARMLLTADANVTFRDYAGILCSAVPLKQGEHFFPVTEISVVSAGSVYIIHDGIPAQAFIN